MNSGALQIALTLFEKPALAGSLRRSPIPPDIIDILRIAADDPAAKAELVAPSGLSPQRARDASIFYLQQVMLHAEADPYRVLCCEPGASLRVRREHMRWLMRWLHPDYNRDDFENQLAERVLSAWNRTKDHKGNERGFPVIGAADGEFFIHGLNLDAAEPPPNATPRLRANRNMLWRVVTACGVAACLFALAGLFSSDDGGDFQHAALVPEIAGMEAAAMNATGQPEAEAEDADERLPEGAFTESEPEPAHAASPEIASRRFATVNPIGPAAQAVEPDVLPLAPSEAATFAPPARVPPPAQDEAPNNTTAETPFSESVAQREPAEGEGSGPPVRDETAVMQTEAEADGEDQILAATAAAANEAAAGGAEANDDAPALSAALASFVSPPNDPADGEDIAETLPLTAQTADHLIESFLQIYEMGDLEALLGLFSADARNNRGGRNAIIEDYASLFADTMSRRLVITNLVWTWRGDDLSGSGRFSATVQRVNRRRERDVTGDIEITVTREDGRVLIREIRHENDLL